MKKILFASTALVAAGMVTAGSAHAASKIDLSLGGYSKWWVVGAWNDSKFTAADNRLGTLAAGTATTSYNGQSYPAVDVKGQNEIFIGGKTTLDNGIKTGVDIHLIAGGNTAGTTDTIDRSYIWVEGGFGKFLVGSQKNGAYLLHVSAPEAAGNWGEDGILSGGFAITKPWGVNEMAGGNTTAINAVDNPNTLTYVAPSFYGLTVGASYIPDGGSTPSLGPTNGNAFSVNNPTSASATTATWTPPVQQVYGVAALYANTIAGVGVKVSAAAAQASIAQGLAGTPLGVKDYAEQSYGTQLSYAGFTLGGSYRRQRVNYGGNSVDLGSLGEQSTAPVGGATGSFGNGQSYDLGLQYATGPYAVSFDFYQSEVQHCRGGLTPGNASGAKLTPGTCTTVYGSKATGNDTVNIYQVSGKYNLGPGVDLLATGGYMEYTSAIGKALTGPDANNNSGWTVMSGVALAF